MPLDLVSPWTAAVLAQDPPQAIAAFRTRHAPLLDALRRQRAPHTDTLPLLLAPERLAPLAARATDPRPADRRRQHRLRVAALGADHPFSTVLLAGDGTGDAAEPLPGAEATVALFLERGDEATLDRGMARAAALLTRWSAPDSASPLRGTAAPWDRWALARDVPLAEWIYGEGVALHLALAAEEHPDPALHLGLSRGTWQRLRERERSLRALLAADLAEAGLGLVLRWLAPDAPPSARRIGTTTLPPAAGRYLGWRMVAERVARLGLADALRADASLPR